MEDRAVAAKAILMRDTGAARPPRRSYDYPSAHLPCRELRLALVCYGGVSLAVYMHGITVELQKLVVASTVFCKDPAQNPPFLEGSTEAAYWSVLKAIAERDGVALRVVVDVISGTSAGGINGIVLAKALALGVEQKPLREVWFDKASLLKLAMPDRLPFQGRGVKVLPWAPLSGRRMSGWAHEALQRMNDTTIKWPGEAMPLVPDDNALDLYVTATDCAGFRRTIDMHDPEAVHDLEYRHILHFHHDPQEDDGTAFNEKADGLLTLAVRSTSSFPGAFPPVTLAEIEAVAGPITREELDPHFESYFVEGAEPRDAFFLDGGVLNNHPFDHAVHSIMRRGADREVDRRLLFIEPHPVEPQPGLATCPSWLHTIRSALSSIPRHQPMADALTDLARHNVRAAEIRQLIALTEPKIFAMIEQVGLRTDNTLEGRKAACLETLDLSQIEQWADILRAEARRQAGASHHAYEAITIGEVLNDLATGLCASLGYPVASRFGMLLHRILRCWGTRRHLLLGEADHAEKMAVDAYERCQDARESFLKSFDLEFRRRRLRFLVRCINDAYGAPGVDAAMRLQLDEAKRRLYKLIATLRRTQSGRWVDDPRLDALKSRLTELFGRETLTPLLASAGAALRPAADATASHAAAAQLDARLNSFVDKNHDALQDAFRQTEDEVLAQLASFKKEQAMELQWLLQDSSLPTCLLRQMLNRYVGYAYWDTVLYPLIAMSRITEPDDVKVIRISSEDTRRLTPRGAANRLCGVRAFHFGAFLKRAYRENDFLWGRLDGVERLMDVLGDVSRINVEAPIWTGFQAVLDTERPTLRTSRARTLVARLSMEVKPHLPALAPS